jgi:hypothetical protein
MMKLQKRHFQKDIFKKRKSMWVLKIVAISSKQHSIWWHYSKIKVWSLVKLLLRQSCLSVAMKAAGLNELAMPHEIL